MFCRLHDVLYLGALDGATNIASCRAKAVVGRRRPGHVFVAFDIFDRWF